MQYSMKVFGCLALAAMMAFAACGGDDHKGGTESSSPAHTHAWSNWTVRTLPSALSDTDINMI